MTPLDERLAEALRDATPQPPRQLDPVAIRAHSVRRERGPRRFAPVLVAAAIIAVAVGIALTRGSDEGRRSGTVGPPSPAPVLTVHGVRVPYAGPIPWSGAIADASDPRVVYVQANGDMIQSVCGLPVERSRVTASSDQVVIHVDGYAKPLSGPCAGVGHPPQRLAIRLPSPLAGRTVVDGATHRAHPVLDPTTVPTVHDVPPSYAASPLTWDDRTGISTRYYTRDPRTSIASQIGLRYAPPTSSTRLRNQLRYGQSKAVTIDGSPGTFYAYTEMVGHTPFSRWTILWTRTDRSQLLLTISGPSRVILSQQVALQLAKDTH